MTEKLRAAVSLYILYAFDPFKILKNLIFLKNLT